MGILCTMIAMVINFFNNPVYLTPEQVAYVETCVTAEAVGENYETQLGVVQTVFNRLASNKYPDDVISVIDQGFSTATNSEVTESVRDAIRTVADNPYIYPTDMYWFRADHYHTFAHPYQHIPGTNTWFSTETDYNAIFLEE